MPAWRMCWCMQCSHWVSWYAGLLRFDHQVSILHFKPRVGSWAIPGRVEDGGGGHEGTASVIPPASAGKHRTVESWMRIIVHVQRRKFHPVVRHHQSRFNVEQQIAYATGSTTHNIAGDILALALGLNNNRTLKSYDDNITKSGIINLRFLYCNIHCVREKGKPLYTLS